MTYPWGLVKFALKMYGLAVMASWFALILFKWWQQLSCLNCVFDVWEPNPTTHLLELAAMMAAIPGIAIIAWESL